MGINSMGRTAALAATLFFGLGCPDTGDSRKDSAEVQSKDRPDDGGPFTLRRGPEQDLLRLEVPVAAGAPIEEREAIRKILQKGDK